MNVHRAYLFTGCYVVFSLRSSAACALVLVLAACGGGGGGGGAATGGGGTVTPPTPSGNNMTQQSVQRADVQNAVAGVQAVREYSTGSSTALLRHRAGLKSAVARAKRAGMFRGFAPLPQASPTSAPGCSGGSTSSTVSQPDGSVIITVSNYYDALCTEIQDTIVWTATQSGSIISGPATIMLYSSSGTVTEAASGQIEFVYSGSTLTGISFLLTSITSNGKSQGQLGIACSASTSDACGVAVANNIYASSIEDGANVSFTASSSSGTSSLSMQVTAYQGAIDSLSIAAAVFPDFTISPSSSQIGSVSISGSESANAVSLTATDNTNGGSVSISGAPSGTITGSVTRMDTGSSVASFTIDAYGNGTLTYGNGTQVPIVNYAVQG